MICSLTFSLKTSLKSVGYFYVLIYQYEVVFFHKKKIKLLYNTETYYKLRQQLYS